MVPSEYDLVIENGTYWTPTAQCKADIAISSGKIAAIGTALGPARKRLDATGLDILPGIWHVHCHFREPGHTYKEDFESGTKTAAAGGVTVCIDMTNNTPHPTTLEDFEAKKALVAPKAYIDYALYGGGLYPRTVEQLAKAGAIGIKIFNTRHIKEVYPYISELGVLDHGILYELYEATRDVGLSASVHHDDPEWCKRLTFRDYIEKNKTDAAAYHESFERGYMYGHGMVAGLAASLYYARIAGVKLHVLHLGVMPVGAYELIRHAKFDLGQQVTAELELGSMLMTKQQMQKIGPNTYNWAHSPEEGWRSIHNGIADVVVLEHAPHTSDETEPGWQDMFSIPLGMTGAQEFVPLLLDSVNKGKLTLNDVALLASEKPARIFGQFPQKGTIQVGSDADLTIVNMKEEILFRKAGMLSRSGHTSWEGMRARGIPVHSIVRGSFVLRDGKIVGVAGHGRFVPGTVSRGANARKTETSREPAANITV
ncbi:dihydroorotase family protein [Mesorhizobium sp. J428]|uniref:dihydroorotase n=1 Tax=Mesorhizobium sp. J428 TaxID=2898440 RepID=UPI0021513B18|nr:dihydroorotase family protein [Mesorhizobium sp. J428]MCR5857205.1 dihydroorotase family protein [Mesorhizobium sp. J428]